ncbi:hypothetical protein C4Z00_000020 [Klebsiella pneumoniae subsp. pneumoniae]|uniref:hypothetical protein n=1 Tax=Klebsiella pneumoniae TaxID=573 RepID=UPI000CEBF8C2|nr:hypothetical protein [Klebsiella pneumoniae]ROE12649.1 hypothetical protein C4Y99_024480 [Klebsiella pneumoniae subsp. pneumoniae]ROE14304.1 hypothetical protein C4Z00_000020 [Klebsiella pneumoniae subsp. pneumoniae]HBR5184141.1 hypothetical protein [Klebsiella pneumoniae]HBS7558027.1 hypothetical protein [Klebsiella pneumoniae]HBT4286479.1 hypothetical protein [Klebsiella pneumoniae]
MNITELALRLKLEVLRAVSNFNPQMNIKTRDLKDLVEALENSESRLHEVAVACATAEQALEKAQQRIAELESRTVKMPEPFKLAKSSSGLTYYFADDVDAALTDAGIKVEAE